MPTYDAEMDEEGPISEIGHRSSVEAEQGENEENEDWAELELSGRKAPICPPCAPAVFSSRGLEFRGHTLLAADVLPPDARLTIVFCCKCGAFFSEKPEALSKHCGGKTPGLALQRGRLAKRKFPQSGDERLLDEPRGLTQAQENFVRERLGPEELEPEMDRANLETRRRQLQQGPAKSLSRLELCICYGVAGDQQIEELIEDNKPAARKAQAKRRQADAAFDEE